MSSLEVQPIFPYVLSHHLLAAPNIIHIQGNVFGKGALGIMLISAHQCSSFLLGQGVTHTHLCFSRSPQKLSLLSGADGRWTLVPQFKEQGLRAALLTRHMISCLKWKSPQYFLKLRSESKGSVPKKEEEEEEEEEVPVPEYLSIVSKNHTVIQGRKEGKKG